MHSVSDLVEETNIEHCSGIYMADGFYAKWTKLFDNGNDTAWDDILTQFVIFESHTRKSSCLCESDVLVISCS